MTNSPTHQKSRGAMASSTGSSMLPQAMRAPVKSWILTQIRAGYRHNGAVCAAFRVWGLAVSAVWFWVWELTLLVLYWVCVIWALEKQLVLEKQNNKLARMTLGINQVQELRNSFFMWGTAFRKETKGKKTVKHGGAVHGAAGRRGPRFPRSSSKCFPLRALPYGSELVPRLPHSFFSCSKMNMSHSHSGPGHPSSKKKASAFYGFDHLVGTQQARRAKGC